MKRRTKIKLPKCNGKRRFRNEAEARRALAATKVSAGNSDRRRECRVYPCGRCGGWHLTSAQQRTKVS